MSEKPSGSENGESPEPEPTRTWIKVIDRVLWGVNAPATAAERSRRWKNMGKDGLGAAKWIGNFFS